MRMREQYELFTRAGLEYGPAYRALERAWTHEGSEGEIERDGQCAMSLLRGTSRAAGVALHPAELDGALQLSTVLVPMRGDSAAETRLPFAVDGALLLGGAADLHAV